MTRRTKPSHEAPDEAAIRSIPQAMIEAWNLGDATAFAAPFAADATFIAFEGTVLTGQDAIVDFHQPLFDTQLKDTRLEGGASFVRFLAADVAVMHARCGVILAGQERTIASRESMQLFVCTRVGGDWRVAALMNARRLTLEQQRFADELESLAPPAQRDVKDRLFSLTRVS